MARQNDDNNLPASPAPQALVTLTLDQLKELIAAGKPSQQEQLELMEKQAELDAKAHLKLNRPENPTHPGVSVFSRSGGEVANPKGQFGYKVSWGGTDAREDQLSAVEFDLLREVPNGEYICSRPDGSSFQVSVEVQQNNATGRIERKDIKFKTAGALRHGLPSMVTMLREMIAQALTSSAASPAGGTRP
jgi:hypothetical protein